jgi:hypothetical protein
MNECPAQDLNGSPSRDTSRATADNQRILGADHLSLKQCEATWPSSRTSPEHSAIGPVWFEFYGVTDSHILR